MKLLAELSSEPKVLDAPERIDTYEVYRIRSDTTVHLSCSAFAEGELTLLRFKAKSNRGTASITVRVGDTAMRYYIPIQWSEVRIPLATRKGETHYGFDIAPNSDLYFGELTADPIRENPDDIGSRTGMFHLEPCRRIVLKDPLDAPAVGKTIDLEIRGNYLYSIGDGGFTVASVADPSRPVRVARLENVGAVRQLALTSDGTAALITCRQDGVAIVDIRDPENPQIRGRYDSVEMATGICVSGRYAFIANRIYGVEVVDIGDIDFPKHLCVIHSGEVQSCRVVGHFLYAGLWGECRVDIYDISDLYSPVRVGSAMLDGRGDGFAVAESADGKRTLLYAATGQHAKKISPSSPLTEPAYGMGNGLDIFDVTDPTTPIHLSTVKVDGRYYYPQNDFWETSFARDSDGREYAYLSNTYNGVYIFDVTDPSAPRRLAHLYIPVAAGSPNFVRLSYRNTSRKILLPFDPQKEVYSPVGAISCREGYLYVAGVYTDVHVLADPELIHEETRENGIGVPVCSERDFYRVPDDRFGFSSLRSYRAGTQVYYAVWHKGLVYAACGLGGIHVLDGKLRFLYRVPTKFAVQYLCFVGDILYTAQTQGGMCLYRLTDSGLQAYGKPYLSENGVVRMLQISENGRWALLQTGSACVETVDVSDPDQPRRILSQKNPGQMYFRNLSNGFAGGRYLMTSGLGCAESVFDFGKDEPQLVRYVQKNTYSFMSNGVAAFGDRFLATANGGYVVFDPLSLDEDHPIPVEKIAEFGKKISGKPSVFGNLLVVSERINGFVHFADISEIQSPKLLLAMKVNGNPDLVTMADGKFYLPLGYGGLYSFDVTEVTTRRP